MIDNQNKPMYPVPAFDLRGFTKREGIAAQIASGMIDNADFTDDYVMKILGIDEKYVHEIHHPKFVAKMTMLYTDALLEELEMRNYK